MKNNEQNNLLTQVQTYEIDGIKVIVIREFNEENKDSIIKLLELLLTNET